MAISDLPGYVQGYKFTDSAAFYDSSGNFFIDQAGYSAFPASRLNITTGTPSFVDVNSARGMVLDNTVQGSFYIPTIFHGSMIIVMGAPSRMSVNGAVYPIIGGNATSITANAHIRMWRVSAASYVHAIWSGGATSAANVGSYGADDGIHATCMTLDQQARRVEGINAAGTLTQGAAIADNQSGVEGFKDIGTVGDAYGVGERFGNLSGTKGDVSATTNTMIICELHYFKDSLTSGDTTALKAELTALETIYG